MQKKVLGDSIISSSNEDDNELESASDEGIESVTGSINTGSRI